MIGRALEAYFPGHLKAEPGEELLRVENLSSPASSRTFRSNYMRARYLASPDLVGAGRTEIAEAMFGLDRLATGRVYVNGKPMPLRHPSVAMRHHIGMVPEDRKRHGLVLMMNAPGEYIPADAGTICGLGDGCIPRRSGGSPKKYFELLRVKAPTLSRWLRDCRAAINRRSCSASGWRRIAGC